MLISRRHFVTHVLPGAALTLALRPAIASASASFDHGVASGDPSATGILLWTRVTPRFEGETEVTWHVARDPELTDIVKSGVTSTTAKRDYTVKVDVEGLEPGQTYFYRFDALGAVSQTGRTRTLPVGALDRFVLGVCSCSNYPAGYFNAYRLLADTDSIDAVLHLGDYIYEYDRAGYASENARELHRESRPGHEIASLDDYRMRHAQYKSDPDLQAAHARHAFITVWDDHESANDSYVTGAQNHDDSEGDWLSRKQAAVQAYYEWMPIREPERRDRSALYRAFELGDLATLAMLETRLSARTEPASVADEMTYRTVDFDMRDPAKPVALPPGAAADLDPAAVRTMPVPFDVRQSPPAPMTDFARLQTVSPDNLPEGFAYLPDTDTFRRKVLADPGRRLMDDTQRQWLTDTLAASTKAGKPWQIIGNQTLMAQLTAPNMADELTPEEVSRLPDYVRPYIGYTRFELPLSTDMWDGYDAERQWICDTFRDTSATPIVLTGDSHSAWANEVLDPRSGNTAALEFGATSISSPGYTETFGISGERISRLLMSANPNVRFSDPAHRGFTTLMLTPDGAEAGFHVVDTILSRDFNASVVKTIGVEPRRGKPPVWVG